MDKKLRQKLQPHLNTRSFFNYKDFYRFIAKQNFKVLVELGSWKGHSTSFLVKELLKAKNENFKLYAVDIWDKCIWKNWKDSPEKDLELGHIYDIYNINVNRFGVRKYITDIKKYSDQAANQFKDNSVDFVFIDADHHEKAVKKDVLAWFPKVKKGGIIAGHDYYNQGPMRAKAAVDALVNEGLLPTIKKEKGSVWYCRV